MSSGLCRALPPDEVLKWHTYGIGPEKAKKVMRESLGPLADKVYNPAMREAEQRLLAGLRKKFPKDAAKLYELNVARYRGQIAGKVHSAVIAQIRKM